MAEKVLKKEACERVSHIHSLSRRVNERKGNNHTQILLNFLEHHVEEIQDLLKKQDDHAYVEIGDLAVLCLELLCEGGQDLDQLMDVCLHRFEKKLASLEESDT